MNTALTKGNLLSAENTLKLSQSGYELLDKKRNILIKECTKLSEKALSIQGEINSTFLAAYSALRTAYLETGIELIEKTSVCINEENSLSVKSRSIMGVEIPSVFMEETDAFPVYGFQNSSSSLDEAILNFTELKKLTKQLAEIENSVFVLSENIKKTQKRTNALKNIIIPKYEEEIKIISAALEEKEREEYSRLKVIKNIL